MRSQRPPAPGEVTDPLGVGAGQADLTNPYERADERYRLARAPYPAAAVDEVWAHARAAGGRRVVDIGAGTGLMTIPLRERGADVTAVEPAPAMAAQLLAQADDVTLVAATGEDTTLPSGCADLVVYAQSWHWLDPERAGAEAARLLGETGRVCVVVNQMDVRVGWVKRLTRIMRSGDVARPDRPPRLGPAFGPTRLRLYPFTRRLTPTEIALIGQTRSSYLRASPAGRAHMRANLEWYLSDLLAVGAHQRLEIPSVTFVWSAQKV